MNLKRYQQVCMHRHSPIRSPSMLCRNDCQFISAQQTQYSRNQGLRSQSTRGLKAENTNRMLLRNLQSHSQEENSRRPKHRVTRIPSRVSGKKGESMRTHEVMTLDPKHSQTALWKKREPSTFPFRRERRIPFIKLSLLAYYGDAAHIHFVLSHCYPHHFRRRYLCTTLFHAME